MEERIIYKYAKKNNSLILIKNEGRNFTTQIKSSENPIILSNKGMPYRSHFIFVYVYYSLYYQNRINYFSNVKYTEIVALHTQPILLSLPR